MPRLSSALSGSRRPIAERDNVPKHQVSIAQAIDEDDTSPDLWKWDFSVAGPKNSHQRQTLLLQQIQDLKKARERM